MDENWVKNHFVTGPREYQLNTRVVRIRIIVSAHIERFCDAGITAVRVN